MQLIALVIDRCWGRVFLPKPVAILWAVGAVQKHRRLVCRILAGRAAEFLSDLRLLEKKVLNLARVKCALCPQSINLLARH